MPLGPGTYTISFSPVAGYETPPPLQIRLAKDEDLIISQSYTRLPEPETPLERYQAFATASGLTGAAAEPMAIPHHDGVPNLLKYAFNMNLAGPDHRPLAPIAGSAGLPVVSVEESGAGGTPGLRIEYLRRKDSGLIYTPEFSSDLSEEGVGSWAPVTEIIQVTPIDDEWERVTASEYFSPGRAARFGRVRVEMP